MNILHKIRSNYIIPEFRSVFYGFVGELEDSIEVDYEIMDEVWSAARNGQADILESLLEERGGIRINKQDDSGDDSDKFDEDYDRYNGDSNGGGGGKSALHYAADAGSFECIRVLLDAGANVRLTTKRGSTALHCAAGSSNVEVKQYMEILVDAGLPLDATDNMKWTVLHFASFRGHPKNAGYLLENGFDPHVQNGSRCTAYHLAVKNCSPNVLKQILEHQRGGIPGIYVSNADGFTPAQLAVIDDKPEFIKKLLKYIDIKELADEEEPFLLFAARKGSAKMMKAIVSSYPDIFVRGNDHSTILHAMAENDANFQQTISNVFQREVLRSDRRLDGSMPLHLLLSGRQAVNEEILDMMIDGKPNDIDGEGNNYLMCLLRSDRPDSEKKVIASDLINLEVNAFQKNKKGKFFYRHSMETNPEIALRITPYIKDIKRWMISIGNEPHGGQFTSQSPKAILALLRSS